MFGFIFINIIIKIDYLYVENTYFYCFNTISPLNGQSTYFLTNNSLTTIISFSHTLTASVPYGYVVTLLNVCNLLSSLLLNAI